LRLELGSENEMAHAGRAKTLCGSVRFVDARIGWSYLDACRALKKQGDNSFTSECDKHFTVPLSSTD